MSSKVYLALAGGTLFGALIIGNPFLAARAAERPAVAAPPALSSAPPIEVGPEGVNLLGQWFAVMGRQLGADGQQQWVLEDGRIVRRTASPDSGFEVVERTVVLAPGRGLPPARGLSTVLEVGLSGEAAGQDGPR